MKRYCYENIVMFFAFQFSSFFINWCLFLIYAICVKFDGTMWHPRKNNLVSPSLSFYITQKKSLTCDHLRTQSASNWNRKGSEL